MNQRTYNVLFLCTGNSARSIMAEAILNSTGGGRFVAFSAGSHPTGTVNPFAIEQTKAVGHTGSDMRSKSWEEFSQPDAPAMDFVITVCDRAAGEVCPVWPGQPVTAHWGFTDPATATGSDEEIRHVFATVCREIKTRLDIFRNLSIEKLDKLALKREMARIGEVKA